MFALTTLALAALPVALAQSSSSNNDEQVLGIYMFHRHGDRTAKSTPPANLTNLGYEQVYRSGQYYRNRYIASDADFRINGVNSDIVKQSQIAVSAPADVVLGHSALGFLQGLYPQVGEQEGVSTLRNGTEVPIPLDGYQLITVSEVDQGTNSENNAWLQSAQGCGQATVSSNQYFSSKEYNDLLESTREFYESLSPVVNGTFNESEINFKNAYTSMSFWSSMFEWHKLTICSSLRPDQRRPNPQHQLPGLRPHQRRRVRPSALPRRHPRMGSRLQ
jgi:hypothetical protein